MTVCNFINVFLFLSENTWKSWSKIGLLTEELNNSKISVRSVTFFRQLAPRRLSMFNYCFFVTILLENPLDQVGKKLLRGIQNSPKLNRYRRHFHHQNVVNILLIT